MITAVGDEPDSTPFTVKSGEFEIEFNPAGAAIESIKLVNHFDNGSPVELIYKDSDDADTCVTGYALFLCNTHIMQPTSQTTDSI